MGAVLSHVSHGSMRTFLCSLRDEVNPLYYVCNRIFMFYPLCPTPSTQLGALCVAVLQGRFLNSTKYFC